MMIFEKRPLIPNDSHKSFYGKAYEVLFCDGLHCISYTTEVCMIDNNGVFIRLWSGYSYTTMRHINAFRVMHGLPAINKAAWCSMKRGV